MLFRSSGGQAAQGFAETATDFIGEGFNTIGKVLPSALQISPTTTEAKAYISLYMPDTLQATYSADWQEMSLGDLGQGISTLRMINQLAPGAEAALRSGDIKKSLGNLASTDPAVVATITGLMGVAGIGGNILNPEAIRDVALKGKGVAINPQLQMIFRGVGFRSFQLSFMFTPRSADESQEVDNIIKTRSEEHTSELQSH